MKSTEIAKWVAEAEGAMRSGDRDRALSNWRRVLAIDADHPRALNAIGNSMLAHGKASEAYAYLARAVQHDPGQPALLFNLAMAARGAGRVEDAISALQSALVIDPYFVQAIFQLAVMYEDSGDLRSAAQVYRNFLDTAPAEILNSPSFSIPLERARVAVATDNAALADRIFGDDLSASPRAREAANALLGKGKIYVSEPTFLSVPRLPAIPFLDRALTPWIETLEAAASVIIKEAENLLNGHGQDAFTPYVANPAGTPLNQWHALDQKRAWGAFFLWKHGVRNDENCALCPNTASVLEALPLVQLDGRAPNAFLSWLDPKTKIPPHTGVTNARVTVHLPLIVPPHCGFRVGSETRLWDVGKAWVFDDTIEHEAWNDSEAPRLILIFDIWHPMLDAKEQQFFTHLLQAYDDHYGHRLGLTDTL
jgi:aspartate beta-hydroxylase